jgi:prepilin-type N-terminal cleavage/methylation domain-containing protein
MTAHLHSRSIPRQHTRTVFLGKQTAKCPDGTPGQYGFTLLEIILSLAILAGALAALGEVLRSASQTASMTEGETQAQILAASLMDELVCGARQLSAVSQTVLDPTANPPWIHSIALENTDYPGIVAVRVAIEQQLDARLRPARFELVRWMSNPEYVAPETSDQSSTSSSSEASSGSSSSSSASSSSSSGSGGQR